MDAIEIRLTELAEKLRAAWQVADVTSPLGELAALAAATLVFYQEHGRTKKPTQMVDESVHWSDTWRRR